MKLSFIVGWGCSSMAEHLPSIHEALALQNKKRKKRRIKGGKDGKKGRVKERRKEIKYIFYFKHVCLHKNFALEENYGNKS
jgi:hypothetical protein